MFIYTYTDGIKSTEQKLLNESVSADRLWKDYAIPFYTEKNTSVQSVANAEFMRMNKCERVRRYVFWYDLSEASKAKFVKLLEKRNPNMSILIVLWPRTPRVAQLYPEVTFPRVVNSVTGTVVDESDLEQISMDGAYQDGNFTRDVGFVMRVYHEGAVQSEKVLDQVDSVGRPIASQLMEDFLKDALEQVGQSNTLELTYHTQCGPMRRYFLHYDGNLTMPMLGRLLHSPDLPAQSGYRITFVPQSSVREPFIVDAGTQEGHTAFGRRLHRF